jgi:hypothetical protein
MGRLWSPFFGTRLSVASRLSLCHLIPYLSIALVLPAVAAQRYVQDFETQAVGGVNTLVWRPTPADPWHVFPLICS